MGDTHSSAQHGVETRRYTEGEGELREGGREGRR